MAFIVVNHTFSVRDGQGQVNRRLVEALAEGGCSIKVITADPTDRFENHPRIRVRHVSVPHRLPAPLVHQVFAWRVWRALRRWREPDDRLILNGSMAYVRCDVNLCHFVHRAWLNSPAHDWHQGRSARSTYQWLFTFGNTIWERLAYRQAKLVVAVSEQVRAELIDLVKVPPDRIATVPNGLDLGRFTLEAEADAAARTALRERLGLDPSVFLIGFCGDLNTRRKNLDSLLAALVRLPGNCHVVAAGAANRGPYPAMLRARGLADRVHLLGRVESMPDFYRACEAFVGISHYEPWGLMLAEAMASELPVVASVNVGAAQLVVEGVSGLRIARPDDVDGLTAALQRLHDDASLRERLGAGARAAAAQVDWPCIGRRYRQTIAGLGALAAEASNLGGQAQPASL